MKKTTKSVLIVLCWLFTLIMLPLALSDKYSHSIVFISCLTIFEFSLFIVLFIYWHRYWKEYWKKEEKRE